MVCFAGSRILILKRCRFHPTDTNDVYKLYKVLFFLARFEKMKFKLNMNPNNTQVV
jgi:hypothetical protein